MEVIPVFWSFRRCPYAMRARLTLKSSRTNVMLREIVLRDKPDEFLKVSSKGTVPVLVLDDGLVLEESLEIMLWALHRQDPEGWLEIYNTDPEASNIFLDRIECRFKKHLDRYKYPNRPEEDNTETETHRRKGAEFLSEIDGKLGQRTFLSGDTAGLLDFATLPFIRQFRGVNPEWFENQDWPHLHPWLQDFLKSSRFTAIMEKYEPWRVSGSDGIPF